MRKIAIIGLGYVGLPLALAFGKTQPVIAYDKNKGRIKDLQKGIDINKETPKSEFKNKQIEFTAQETTLKKADFYIVTVPTPATKSNKPDFKDIVKATETIGKYLKKGDVVVYESTVYPGATEEICIPLLEKTSGLKHLKDFNIGYSPERMNPGDKVNTLENIVKIVSGDTPKTLKLLTEIYGPIIKAGLHQAPSIKVAEASKIIENIQRDVNIAFMNELVMMFHPMGISMRDVLAASRTRWNFVNFTPGLVGGHCVAVDPYYLIDKAEKIKTKTDVIKSARKVNTDLPKFIAKNILENLPENPSVTVLGFTFKENCADTRNTRVADIVKTLKKAGAKVQVSDGIANREAVKKEYGMDLVNEKDLKPADAVIIAVAHDAYKKNGWKVTALLKNGKGLVADIKAVLDESKTPKGVKLWRM